MTYDAEANSKGCYALALAAIRLRKIDAGEIVPHHEDEAEELRRMVCGDRDKRC